MGNRQSTPSASCDRICGRGQPITTIASLCARRLLPAGGERGRMRDEGGEMGNKLWGRTGRTDGRGEHAEREGEGGADKEFKERKKRAGGDDEGQEWVRERNAIRVWLCKGFSLNLGCFTNHFLSFMMILQSSGGTRTSIKSLHLYKEHKKIPRHRSICTPLSEENHKWKKALSCPYRIKKDLGMPIWFYSSIYDNGVLRKP